MKPIYEVYFPETVTVEQAEKYHNILKKRIGDEYHVAVFYGNRYESIRTKIIYPKATFWGWWYNLWNT